MATTAGTEREIEIQLAEIFRKLEQRIQEAGSLNTAAAVMGISPQYLSNVLKGNRAPGEGILRNLGVRKRRITVYTRMVRI